MLFYWDTETDPADVESFITASELEESCNEMLDEIYDVVKICDVDFYPSRIVHTDEPLWRQVFGEYLSAFTSCDVPWAIYADGINDGTSDEKVREFIVNTPSRWMVGE